MKQVAMDMVIGAAAIGLVVTVVFALVIMMNAHCYCAASSISLVTPGENHIGAAGGFPRPER